MKKNKHIGSSVESFLLEEGTLDSATTRAVETKSGRIGLKARLAMCDFSQPRSQEEQDWLDAPPVGREAI